MMDMMEDHQVWRQNLELRHRNRQGKAGNEERRRPFWLTQLVI